MRQKAEFSKCQSPSLPKCSVTCTFSSLTSVKLIFFFHKTTCSPPLTDDIALLNVFSRSHVAWVNLKQKWWQVQTCGTWRRSLIYNSWWRISSLFLWCMEEASLFKTMIPKSSHWTICKVWLEICHSFFQCVALQMLAGVAFPASRAVPRCAVPSCGKSQVSSAFVPKPQLPQDLEGWY